MKHWLNHSVAIATILFSLNVTAQDSSIANNPSARAALRSGVVGRAIDGAPMLGAELTTYELSTIFSEVNGRWGESRVFDGILYTLGKTDASPVVSTLNFNTGETGTIVFEKLGTVSGVFKKNDQLVFTGWSISSDNYYLTSWDQTGKATVNTNVSGAYTNDVSSSGRMALSILGDFAGYADVGDNAFHVLPGNSEFSMTATSITSDSRYIGASGGNRDLNFQGVVYELVNGVYVVLKDDYKAPRGEDVTQMHLYESPNGIVSLSTYTNSVTYFDETVLFSLSGVSHAELPGSVTSAVTVGDKFLVATQGDDGYLTVFNTVYEKKMYTATELFGAGFEFQAGSLAVTADGKLVVIGTRTSDGKVFVKTFEVPQDVTLSQVDVNSINIPSLVVGQSGNITWAPVAGATGYDYEIAKGDVVVSTGSVATNSLAVPTNLAPGTYVFRVRAMSTARALPQWSSKNFTVSDLPDYIKNVLVKVPAGVTDFQIQILPKKGKALVYKGMTNVVNGLMALAPGKYTVKVLIPKQRAISVIIEKFHPAVTPAVRLMPDGKHVISWTGDGVAEIWVAKKNQQSKVVYLMKVSKGNVHKLAKALPAGEHVVRVRLNKADGSKSLWGSGAVFYG
jgi:hypothetical protein